METLGQIIGIVAAAMIILSFQAKDTVKLYIIQTIGGVLFAISFFMLGSTTAALLNLIGLPRGIILTAGPKWNKWYVLVAIEAAILAIGIFSYAGYLSIVTVCAQLVGTAALWTRKGKMIRILQFCVVSPLWLFNNIMSFAIGGIITEVVSMMSVIVSIIRFGFNGFEDAPKQKKSKEAGNA